MPYQNIYNLYTVSSADPARRYEHAQERRGQRLGFVTLVPFRHGAEQVLRLEGFGDGALLWTQRGGV
jgi:hypothetical protein